MKKKQPEQIVKNAIMDYLWMKHCFCWVNASTGVFDPKRGIFRKNLSKYQLNGVADILGIWDSKPLAVECKALGGKPTPDQINFLNEFHNHGGIAIWADSLDMLIEKLDKI